MIYSGAVIHSHCSSVEDVEEVEEVADEEDVAQRGREAEEALQEIQATAERVVTDFSGISDRLQEQSSASGEAAQNMERAAAMAETNDRVSQDVAEASAELSVMAGHLRDIVGSSGCVPPDRYCARRRRLGSAGWSVVLTRGCRTRTNVTGFLSNKRVIFSGLR